MQSFVEVFPGPDQHIGGAPEAHARKRPVPRVTPTQGGRRVVRHHDHQVVVAVGAGVAARVGAEEVDALGVVRRHQAPDDLGEDRVVLQLRGFH